MKKADYFAPRMPPGYVWSFDPEAQKLTFTCDHHHTRTVSTSQVVNRFSVCRAQNIPFCADCNKLTRTQASQEEWQKRCTELGFQFQSHDPKTRMLTYRCNCGEIKSVYDSNINHNLGGCRQCSQLNNRNHILDVQQIFAQAGCQLLTADYQNNKQLLNYICSCGQIGHTGLSDFKSRRDGSKRGQRCANCAAIRTKETCLQKYGVENPAQASDFEEKTRQTCLREYGVEHHSQAPHVQAKKEASCLQSHGVTTVLMLPEIQQQANQAMIAKYGYAHGFQVPLILEKIRQQNRARYGTDYVFESPLFWEEQKEKNRRLYGVDFHTQLETWKEKIKEIMMERYGSDCYLTSDRCKDQMMENYGVEYASQAPEVKEQIKQTCLERYGSESFFHSGEYKRQMIEKYGVEYAAQASEVKDRIRQTCLERYGSESFLQSRQFKNVMIEKYGVENSMHSYELFRKAVKAMFSSKNYQFPSGKSITLMGYEGCCMDILIGKVKSPKYFGKIYSEEQFQEPPPVPYHDYYQQKERIYYPDIYVDGQIIEVKSIWTYNLKHQLNQLKFLEASKHYPFQVWIFSKKKELLEIITYYPNQTATLSNGTYYLGQMLNTEGEPGVGFDYQQLSTEERPEIDCSIIRDVIEEM